MTILLHAFLFVLSAAVIWGLSGLLVTATDRVAKRYNRPGFAIAFFVLGMLTSISEMSVAVNATIDGVPSVSAGNLIGGIIVIFLLIIPLLAVLGGGIAMSNGLTRRNLAFLLVVVAAPALFALDGELNPAEGTVMILLYIALFYSVQKRKPADVIAQETVREVREELLQKRTATLLDIGKIAIAGLLIFLSGKLLVDESLFFSALLAIPPSVMGLLLLAIGTNAPELVIAVRCVIGRNKDIAFGDYMGSAAANTPILGILILANGRFTLADSAFVPTVVTLVLGLVLFYIFSWSKHDLSRTEGVMLLLIYAVFLILQVASLVA